MVVVVTVPFATAETNINKNHDPETGRFTSGPNSMKALQLQDMANKAGIDLEIKDTSGEDNSSWFTAIDGKLMIVIGKDTLNKTAIKEIKISNDKWNSKMETPYASVNILADKNGYDKYHTYVMDHELEHFAMYKYVSKHTAKLWEDTVKSSVKSGWKVPTYYGKTDYGEAYAECATLHKHGLDTYLHKNVIEFIDLVNSEVKTYA